MKLKDIWPMLGDKGPSQKRKSPSYTKKGPGRYHKQGKTEGVQA